MTVDELKKLIDEYGGLLIDDEYGRANQRRDAILAAYREQQAHIEILVQSIGERDITLKNQYEELLGAHESAVKFMRAWQAAEAKVEQQQAALDAAREALERALSRAENDPNISIDSGYYLQLKSALAKLREEQQP